MPFGGRDYKVPKFPIVNGSVRAELDGSPPLTGEHRTEILQSLGYEITASKALLERGVIAGPYQDTPLRTLPACVRAIARRITIMSEAIDRRLQALLDKQEIHEVLMRYCRGVDRCDLEAINSVYHPDAVDEHGAFTLRGDECGETWIRLMPTICEASMHSICNELIEVDGDVAFSESYFLNYLIIDREGVEMTRAFGGRYVDRFERRHGVWRIAHRVVVHEWDRVDAVTEQHWPRPLQFSTGKRSRDDAVYQIR